VEFLFDVGSPYTWIAALALPGVAARTGARVEWVPMLLGGVFKATGNHSPAEIPAKARWTANDLARQAARFGQVYTPNPHFPVNTLALMRMATGLGLRRPRELGRFLDAVFDAMWVTPRNLNEPAEVGATLAAAGFDAAELAALAIESEVKSQLKANTEQAVARGVFGAPSFFVGDALFWGQDRLGDVEAALGAA
jgi:2-hydroxychromene-2-carboxylate isomerase